MDKLFFKLITPLLSELGLSATTFQLNILAGDEKKDVSLNKEIVITRKNNSGDYFIFAEVSPDELPIVNRDFQIELLAKLNLLMTNEGKHLLNGLESIEELELDNSFEKNTNLLLLVPFDTISKGVLSQVTDIEEDEYFFKKQIIMLPKKYYADFPQKTNTFQEKTIIKYLQNIVSDTHKFQSFIKKPMQAVEYFGTAQLFEKLPFLHLITDFSKQTSLQAKIDKLIEEKAESDKLAVIASKNSGQGETTEVGTITQNTQEIIDAALSSLSEEEQLFDSDSFMKILQGDGNVEL